MRTPARSEAPRKAFWRGALGALTLALATTPALAQETEEPAECAERPWPLARETALLDGATVQLSSGDAASWSDGAAAFVLATLPKDAAGFVMEPGGPSRQEGERGAVARLPAPLEAGLYQVSVSENAWIDVVQGGAFVRSQGFNRTAGCVAEKVVRFELVAAPLTIQLNGAAGETVKVAVTPVAE